jgi:hypothetical protein
MRARSAPYPGIRSARRARSVVFAFPRSGAQKRTRMWRSALARVVGPDGLRNRNLDKEGSCEVIRMSLRS